MRGFFPLLGILALWSHVARADTPKVGVEQAARIAQEELKSRGADREHYVAALTLERSSLTSTTEHWFARYMPGIPLQGRRLIGLRISMNGDVARVVSESAGDVAKRPKRVSIRETR